MRVRAIIYYICTAVTLFLSGETQTIALMKVMLSIFRTLSIFMAHLRVGIV